MDLNLLCPNVLKRSELVSSRDFPCLRAVLPKRLRHHRVKPG